MLDEEQLAFLVDPGILASQAQTIIPHNAAFQTEDLDTYDSDCDDLSTAQAVLMANISNYGSEVILEDILRQSDCLDLLSEIPWVVPTFAVIEGERFSMMLLEHQDIIVEFCGPSRKELSKETSSKIPPCCDGSCWKTFKPIASLIAKGKVK
nr:hypothetical protein [Tanacetum cinerariifolium]